MKTSFVSTPAFANALRLSMRQAQADLFVAQRELASSRHDDVGLTLGNQTGLTITLRRQFEQLNTITNTNSLVEGRVQATQVALDGLLTGAETFMQAAIAARDSSNSAELVQKQAQEALQGLIDGLNANFGSQNLFGGINVDQQPLNNYFAVPANANKAAVDAAFVAAFGFGQNDPNVSTITPAQLQTFLDNDFAALFDAPQWQADWSSASSVTIESRISTSEVVTTSVSANEAPFRTLAEGYAMVADLGADLLDATAYPVLLDQAIQKIGEAIGGITATKARLGTVEGRIAQANQRMSLQIDILQKQVGGLENIDPYEASTRVSQLTSQVEVAYALTARMQRLGIMQFL